MKIYCTPGPFVHMLSVAAFTPQRRKLHIVFRACFSKVQNWHATPLLKMLHLFLAVWSPARWTQAKLTAPSGPWFELNTILVTPFIYLVFLCIKFIRVHSFHSEKKSYLTRLIVKNSNFCLFPFQSSCLQLFSAVSFVFASIFLNNSVLLWFFEKMFLPLFRPVIPSRLSHIPFPIPPL